MSEQRVTKYPKDVFTAMTSNKTFNVTGELTAAHAFANENNENELNSLGSTYKVYDKFARFVFTLIKKEPNGSTSYQYGNIKVNEIPDIIANTEAAKNAEIAMRHTSVGEIEKTNSMLEGIKKALQHMYYYMRHGHVKKEEKTEDSSFVPTGAAENTKFKFGKFKDKSPLEILRQDPSMKKELEQQIQFLQKNADKYEANKNMIAAIKEAFEMQDRGMISKEDAGESSADSISSVSRTIPLYKPVPKTLFRKEKDGLCQVYEIGIDWIIGDNYPVLFTIRTYYAPVKRNENGTINPIRKQAVNEEVNNYRMTSAQWMECLYMIKTHMWRFEMLNAKRQFEEADKAFWKNKEEAKKKEEQTA